MDPTLKCVMLVKRSLETYTIGTMVTCLKRKDYVCLSVP